MEGGGLLEQRPEKCRGVTNSDPITRLNAALEGRYKIERELGEGGMATVYLAHDERHNRNVALKVLKAELAAVVGAERFLAEIETTAKLTHPHILPLHDSGEADGFLFFVTPYIEGDTLRDKIDREKQLSVDEALKITEDVASALDYAHKHGVVHRDIKPGNILLSPEGEPTVADFGIALAVAHAGGGRVTETGLSVGTELSLTMHPPPRDGVLVATVRDGAGVRVQPTLTWTSSDASVVTVSSRGDVTSRSTRGPIRGLETSWR